MATLPLIAARSTRSAVALATAVALLLPLPTRCASCATSQGQCPRCVHHFGESLRGSQLATPRTCCQELASTQSAANASNASPSVQQSQHTCGCGFHQAPRSTPPVEKTSISLEQSAGLVATPFSPAAPSILETPASDITLAALIPTIPHRILHCTWII